MLLENEIYFRQIKTATDKIGNCLENLKNCAVLVTGASGMLGSCVVDMLVYLNEHHGMDIEIYASGRHKGKIEKRFHGCVEKNYFHVKEFDVSLEQGQDIPADYIIHAASNADPFMFAEYPADTLLANVLGVKHMLDLALKNHSKRLLYVSSGEMYGQPDDAALLEGFSETYCGYVDYQDARSCYPSGKRAGEVLCQSYIKQYGVDAVIVRPCHCYSPTMTGNDSRALSQFFQNALQGKDIVLKSSGEMVRSHCYGVDAAAGILKVLLEGGCGEAYNIADPASVVSIRTAAELIAKAAGRKVCFEMPGNREKQGYSKVSRAVLYSKKLFALGWQHQTDMQAGVYEVLQILGR